MVLISFLVRFGLSFAHTVRSPCWDAGPVWARAGGGVERGWSVDHLVGGHDAIGY